MAPDTQYDPRYLRGIDLFNGGDYFSAHEEWEHLWRDCPPADRRFYQSLIQAAVALYHHRRGNREGADRQFRAGREKAAGYPPVYRGLDRERFWSAVAATFTHPAHPDPPRITLDPPPGPATWDRT